MSEDALSQDVSVQKLLVAIVHHDDAEAVADGLRQARIRFTRIPSFGGFLGEPNETYLMAVADDEVEHALTTLEGVSHPREVEVPLVLLDRLADWKAQTVAHGGATVLIVDLERIVRI
jgi:uncharacterized protein YaaQ